MASVRTVSRPVQARFDPLEPGTNDWREGIPHGVEATRGGQDEKRTLGGCSYRGCVGRRIYIRAEQRKHYELGDDHLDRQYLQRNHEYDRHEPVEHRPLERPADA